MGGGGRSEDYYISNYHGVGRGVEVRVIACIIIMA